MQAPTSYAGPRRKDKKADRTYSQTVRSNTSSNTSTVADLIEKKGTTVFSVRKEDEITKAIETLNEKRIGAVLVLSDAGKLEGILSERDIVRKMLEIPGRVRMQTVETLMTKKVQTCSPDEALMTVLRRMTDGRFRHMPVMDGDTLKGVLTIGDVVHYRLEELEHEAVQLKQMVVG